MALFEFEDGRLVPAQFGYPVAQDLGPELVDAICQQVLQIVSRPLFPVTWRDMTGQGEEETPRLTALDVTGQIVSVEILKELDSETLIASLSRLAEVASISWSDLANEYPSGPEGFRTGWAQFRDSMPPAVGPGPRLIMVAGDIDPSVRPALSLLATSGVEVHLMNLRQMSNGRLFLDVNAVGPRLYGHAPQVLASAAAAPELTAPETVGRIDGSAGRETPADGHEPRAEVDGETPTTRPTPKVAPHLRDVFSYPMSEEPPAPWQSGGADEAQDEEPSRDDSADQDAPDRDGNEVPDAPENVGAGEGGADADAVGEQPVADADFGEADAGDVGDAEASDERDGQAPPAAFDAPASTDEAEGHEDSGEEPRPVAAEAAGAAQDETEAAADEAEGETEGGELADGTRGGDEETDEAWEHPEEVAAKLSNEEEEPRWERPAHLGSRAARRARAGDLNDAGATDAATASFVDREEESAEVTQARQEGVPVLSRDESGLRALAQILGEDTPLVARSELGLPSDLMLTASGAISGAGLTYPSLDTLLTARGLGHIRAWAQVRIGDRLGPTLAEALDEINREIVREYSQSPRARRSARH